MEVSRPSSLPSNTFRSRQTACQSDLDIGVGPDDRELVAQARTSRASAVGRTHDDPRGRGLPLTSSCSFHRPAGILLPTSPFFTNPPALTWPRHTHLYKSYPAAIALPLVGTVASSLNRLTISGTAAGDELASCKEEEDMIAT